MPVKQHMSCRHCNEAEKFERKEERRKSLEMGKQFAEVKSGEIHNKGLATHQNFVSHSNVALARAMRGARRRRRHDAREGISSRYRFARAGDVAAKKPA